MSLRYSAVAAVAILSAPSHAQTLTANFDGATGVPPGFAFIENGTNGGSTFSIANGSGPTGSGDDAGEVSAEIAAGGRIAGGWLSTLAPYDATAPFSGSFDFYLVTQSSAADASLQFTSSPDATFSGWKAELSNDTNFAQLYPITNGFRGGSIASAIANIAPSQWYSATFSWTPTGGSLGRLVCNITDRSNGANAGGFDTASISAFAMPPVVHIGLGSNNDQVRFDNIQLTGTQSSGLLANANFESSPFAVGWTATQVTSTGGLGGSSTGARLGWNTDAILRQPFAFAVQDFTLDVAAQVAGTSVSQGLRIALESAAGIAIELRTRSGGVLQLNNDGSWVDLLEASSGAPFAAAANQTMMFRIVGRDIGLPNATFDLAWSDPGVSALSHAATGLSAFASPPNATQSGGMARLDFSRTLRGGHSYVVDQIVARSSALPTPAPDFVLPIDCSELPTIRLGAIEPAPNGDSTAAYVRIDNTTNSAQPLANVTLSGDVMFAFPSSGAPQLAAGASTYVVADPIRFQAVVGASLPIAGTFADRLTAAPVELRDDAGLLDRFFRGSIVGRELSLDGDWMFWAPPTLAQACRWDTLAIPGNWDTYTEYADYRGDGFYRITTRVPPSFANQRLRLCFDAVYDTATVWWNDSRLGQHIGGYTPFEFDVTTLATPGETATITVRANNTFKTGAWWPWGGMSGGVHLRANEDLRISNAKIEAVPSLQTGTATVTLHVIAANAGNATVQAQINATIAELPTLQLAASGSVPAGGEARLSASVVVPSADVRLWHVDAPNLYHLRTELAAAGSTVDTCDDRFGIRELRMTNNGMLLNGEPVRMFGYNRVHDHRAHGQTEPRHLVRRDVDMMKRAGLNFARIMHAPCAPDLLDYCDERGVMIWAEIPVWQSNSRWPMGTRAEARANVTGYAGNMMREMIERDWNHPCIVGWSPGNEMRNEYATYVDEMAVMIRALDPTRLVAHVTNRGPASEPSSVDVTMRNNYGNQVSAARSMRAGIPNKPVFMSEWGSSRNESLGFSQNFVQRWIDLGNEPYVVGGAVWTFNDYRSDFGGTPPSQNRDWGAVDIWRNEKIWFRQLAEIQKPIRSISVRRRNGVPKASIRIDPRSTSEIPSFTLRDYSLAYEILDLDDNVVDGQLIALPDIAPGSSPIRRRVSWNAKSAATLIATLVSATGYSVATTRFDLAANRAVALPTPPPPRDPDIRAVYPLDRSVMLGWTSQSGDVGVEVQHGPNRFQLTETVTAEVRGAVRVRGLTNGAVRCFRLRRLLAGGGAGPWSDVIHAVPDGGLAPQPPVVYGAVRGADSIAIRYTPSPKTEAYEVAIQGLPPVRIDCVDPGLLIVPTSGAQAIDYATIAAVGEHGSSEAIPVRLTER